MLNIVGGERDRMANKDSRMQETQKKALEINPSNHNKENTSKVTTKRTYILKCIFQNLDRCCL